MSRWPPDSCARMKAVALRLFVERGFADVKGGEIAAAAGVSERTFFRHFKAKEDVLFEDHSGLRQELAARVADAPPDAGSRDILQSLADLLSERLADHREEALSLRGVIAKEPSLRARELLRDQQWSADVAESFVGRGFSPLRARMLASAMLATFRVAFDLWLADDKRPSLAECFARALAELSADLR